MPTVSVIVPNYNHARYLRKRIDSILAQTYQDFELILLDDCSTDESREILNSYRENPKVRIEFNEANSGTPFKQWNKGVRMARGKYIWMAESDDYAEPELLEVLVAQLETDQAITMAFCRSWRIEDNDQVNGFAESHTDCLDLKCWTTDFVAEGAEFCREVFTLTNPVPNASAVAFRKETYQQVGGADEDLRLCGDYKLWALLALEGKVAYAARPLNYFRWHSQNVRSTTRSGALDVAEYFYVMEWILKRVAAPETLAKDSRAPGQVRELPACLTPAERVNYAMHRMRAIAKWNLLHNSRVSRDVVRTYFIDWELALTGKEFEFAPPSRWRFFLHRMNFLRWYFPVMDWKARSLNLGRLIGAPLVGYRHRHWPEQAYRWIVGATKRICGNALRRRA